MTKVIPWNVWRKMTQDDKDRELHDFAHRFRGTGMRRIRSETFTEYVCRKLGIETRNRESFVSFLVRLLSGRV